VRTTSPAGRLSAAAVVLLSLLFPAAATLLAAPVSCHCFRDRTFDPANPAKADPYLLATTQNSFFAVAFGIPKKALVQAKMKGVSGDDLWIAYYVGSILRLPPGSLMASKEKTGSWKEVLENRRVPLDPLGRRFLTLLERRESDAALAAAATGEVLSRTLRITPDTLDPLLARGLPTGKIVIATLLARWSGVSAPALLEDVESGKATWGSLLSGLGIHPDALEERIGLLIGASRRR
jgi:hypothetical protein